MTMKLPQKAGFVATPDEWDALVRIAENLAAQVVQRDAALREMQAERDAAQSSAGFWGRSCAKIMAERDAERAEVARLRLALEDAYTVGDVVQMRLYIAAALRGQPAPAGCPECGHPESEHKHGVGENGPELFCGAWGCACVRQPAPAQDDARAAMIEILEDEPGPAQGQE